MKAITVRCNLACNALQQCRASECPLWVKSGLSSQRHSMSALPLKADIQTVGQNVR